MTQKKRKHRRPTANGSAGDADARTDLAEEQMEDETSSGTDPDVAGDTESAAEKEAAAASMSRKDLVARLSDKSVQLQEMHNEIAQKSAENKELKDKWLRAVAEFENYRKRSRKEWELLRQQSKTEVILEILNVVDDFERAFSMIGDSEDDEFVQGMRLIYNNLIQVLTKLGVTEAEAQDVPFDPTVHMAISQLETDSAQSGAVVEVVQKGYLLDGTVIRPAKVVVAK